MKIKVTLNQKRQLIKVVLPPNSKFISATGANGNYNANTNTLTLNISNIHGGNTKDISYTVEFEAMRPKLVDLNGQISYKTNAPFRGDGSQKQATILLILKQSR